MKGKILVFGNGLLGSSFQHVKNAVIIGREECDITQPKQITAAINKYHPDAVINCAGAVPKRATPVEQVFKTNAFAPHYIADACAGKIPFIHISTDCVFEGDRGKYAETDEADATGLYGMSKLLGEPLDALVIRTSFVGLPDPKGRGLLAWASQQDEIIGFDKVFWNGVTTPVLVRQLLFHLDTYSIGKRHIYSYTVSKYELLQCAREVFGWNYIIYPESDKPEMPPHILDRTLTSVYATGFISTPIRQQLEEVRDVYQRQNQ